MPSTFRSLLWVACSLPILAAACGSDPDDSPATEDGGSSGSNGASSNGGGASGSSGATSSGASGGSGSSGASTTSSGGSSGASGGGADASLDDASIDAGTEGGGGTCAAAERCDGLDDDNCNGTVDEGCGRCPLLHITCPEGCCAVDRWEIDQVRSENGPSVATDSAGNIYYAYTVPNGAGWQAWLAVYDAVPGVWRKRSVGPGTYHNKVLVDAQGKMHLIFGKTGGVWYRTSTDLGVTLSDESYVGDLGNGGSMDMALDSQGVPHVAFNAERSGTINYGLTYASLVGTVWQSETLDPSTQSPEGIDLELGPLDRPAILTSAYAPGGQPGYAKRIAFYNGNRWLFENVDSYVNGSSYGLDAGRGHSLLVRADGTMDVLFTRTTASVPGLFFARRTAGDAGTWTTTPIATASNFVQPTLFLDARGRRAAVSDGLTLHRELVPGTWTSTSLNRPGTVVAQARRGEHLILGYSDPSNALRPTVTVLDLDTN